MLCVTYRVKSLVNLLVQISMPMLCCSIHGKVGEELIQTSLFWLSRKRANFSNAVSWSTTSITQEQLTVVNNTAFIHYTMYKDHVQQPQGVSFWSKKW